MSDITKKIKHMERSIDMLVGELIADKKLRVIVACLLKTPARGPTAKEVEYGMSLAPLASRVLKATGIHKTTQKD